MKKEKTSVSGEEKKFPIIGQIVVSGEDGETWYLVNAKDANSDDFDRMQEDKPAKIPMLINDTNLEEWRQSPRMDSTLVGWRKKKGKR